MKRIFSVFIGLFLLLLSTNIVSANTGIVEVIVKPSVELNFSQGLKIEGFKDFQVETIIKKIEDLKSVEVLPLPKEPLEIVFPKVVIDDVIVYLHEKPSSTIFAIGDKQYYMNTPSHLFNQQSPG